MIASSDKDNKERIPRLVSDDAQGKTQSRPAKSTQTGVSMNDVYSKPPEDWLSEPELEEEELKRLVQSDALRAYGWVRRTVTAAVVFIKSQFALIQPRLRWLKPVLKRKPHKKLVVMVTAVTILAGVLYSRFVPVLLPGTQESGGVLAELNTPPDFTTIEPPSAPDGDIAFDPERRIASYQGPLGTSRATVTQQPLPDQFKQNPAASVQQLALSLHNKSSINQLETTKGTLYVAQNNNGAQTGIFTHNELLIFITTTSEQPIDVWIQYVDTLK